MKGQGAAGHFKVHSLIDKVYSRVNLRLAWQKVRANRGAGGVCWPSSQTLRDLP